MKLRIVETGELKEIGITEACNSVSRARYIPMITSLFSDGTFRWVAEADTYLCKEESFNRWSKIVGDIQVIDARFKKLLENGYDSTRLYRTFSAINEPKIDWWAARASQVIGALENE